MISISDSSRIWVKYGKNFFPSFLPFNSFSCDQGLQGSEAHKCTQSLLRSSPTSRSKRARPEGVVSACDSRVALRTLRPLPCASFPRRLEGPQHSSTNAVCLGPGTEKRGKGKRRGRRNSDRCAIRTSPRRGRLTSYQRLGSLVPGGEPEPWPIMPFMGIQISSRFAHDFEDFSSLLAFN